MEKNKQEMKYIILADSENLHSFTEPRQLTKINGEALIERTIRLLKENGIKDILITSHDKRFDNLGATRYEPKFNDYKPKENKGYWLSAFPIELLEEPITFLFGDVYYSENAIKIITKEKTKSILFFCSYQNKDERYIKLHDEPFAFKVKDYELFKKHISIVKKLKDEGKTCREPITWELYRSINNLDINTHKLTENYIAINDISCDVDRKEDAELIEFETIENCIIKLKAIADFSLEDFDKLKKLQRVYAYKNNYKELYTGDVFECDKKMAKYLLGANPKQAKVAEIIEIKPNGR